MFIDNQQKSKPAGSVSAFIIPNISIIFDCPNSHPGWYYKIECEANIGPVDKNLDQLLVIILRKSCMKKSFLNCEYFVSSLYCLFSDFEC